MSEKEQPEEEHVESICQECERPFQSEDGLELCPDCIEENTDALPLEGEEPTWVVVSSKSDLMPEKEARAKAEELMANRTNEEEHFILCRVVSECKPGPAFQWTNASQASEQIAPHVVQVPPPTPTEWPGLIGSCCSQQTETPAMANSIINSVLAGIK